MCTVRGFAGISEVPRGLSVSLKAVMAPGVENGTASS